MTHASKAARPWVLVGLVILSASCTFKLAYSYADWLALWQLDHYFDLTRTQKEFLSDRLESVLAEHRQRSLPKYESVLSKVHERFRSGLTGEDVDWIFAAYEELRDDLFGLIVEDGAQFLTSVDKRQARYLEQMFRKSNEEAKQRLPEHNQGRLAERAESTVDWLEDWLGHLTIGQEDEIRRLSLALPDTLEAWLDYRQHRQEDFLRLVTVTQNGGEAPNLLRKWLLRPFRGAPPQYLEAREQMRAGVKEMALSIDRMMTPTQRRHLLNELEEVMEDLHDLSAD